MRRQTDPAEDQVLFERAVVYIREHGVQRKFEPTGSKFIYLAIDGRQYWTMGAPLPITIILNRAWLDWKERLDVGGDSMSVATNDPRKPQSLT